MVNPDRKHYDLVPRDGDLRYVERDGERILQRYEWCFSDNRFDWFDVPTVDEKQGRATND